ncbi:MAG: metallophosphoesterase, partial [Acidobacteria bacterium]|nr:metallophosphoesterase [Acidobacteriota bacterium]
MVRFVHTADWQLGMTRHFLREQAQARFSAARIDAIGTIGELAAEEGCDFVVVCGDVFESNQIARQVLVRALEKMRATPQVTFYLLPGNHDPLDASSIYRSPTFKRHRPSNVAVLDGSEPVQAGPGVELIAAPWPNKRPLSDLVGDACEDLPPPPPPPRAPPLRARRAAAPPRPLRGLPPPL